MHRNAEEKLPFFTHDFQSAMLKTLVWLLISLAFIVSAAPNDEYRFSMQEVVTVWRQQRQIPFRFKYYFTSIRQQLYQFGCRDILPHLKFSDYDAHEAQLMQLPLAEGENSGSNFDRISGCLHLIFLQRNDGEPREKPVLKSIHVNEALPGYSRFQVFLRHFVASLGSSPEDKELRKVVMKAVDFTNYREIAKWLSKFLNNDRLVMDTKQALLHSTAVCAKEQLSGHAFQQFRLNVINALIQQHNVDVLKDLPRTDLVDNDEQLGLMGFELAGLMTPDVFRWYLLQIVGYSRAASILMIRNRWYTRIFANEGTTLEHFTIFLEYLVNSGQSPTIDDRVELIQSCIEFDKTELLPELIILVDPLRILGEHLKNLFMHYADSMETLWAAEILLVYYGTSLWDKTTNLVWRAASLESQAQFIQQNSVDRTSRHKLYRSFFENELDVEAALRKLTSHIRKQPCDKLISSHLKWLRETMKYMKKQGTINGSVYKRRLESLVKYQDSLCEDHGSDSSDYAVEKAETSSADSPVMLANSNPVPDGDIIQQAAIMNLAAAGTSPKRLLDAFSSADRLEDHRRRQLENFRVNSLF